MMIIMILLIRIITLIEIKHFLLTVEGLAKRQESGSPSSQLLGDQVLESSHCKKVDCAVFLDVKGSI